MLCRVFAIVADCLRDRLALDLYRPPAGRWHRSLPSGQRNQALLSQSLEHCLPIAFVVDRRDDRDGVPAVGQDDLFARPHRLDGLRETLVGFTESKPHVVMILHLGATDLSMATRAGSILTSRGRHRLKARSSSQRSSVSG